MTSVQTGSLLSDNSDALGFGLGWSVVRNPSGMTTLKPVGTFGHVGAYGSEYWFDRSRGISVVFMAQGFGNTDRARKVFDTMVNAAFVGKE
jgi:CubicO group peptidase (beta-lactamase class C family)